MSDNQPATPNDNATSEHQLTTPNDNNTPVPNTVKCTPAVDKVRQARQIFHVQSPSDAIMSPCTQKLNLGVQKARRPISSNPANVLRFKQQNAIKLNLEDADKKSENKSAGDSEPKPEENRISADSNEKNDE